MADAEVLIVGGQLGGTWVRRAPFGTVVWNEPGPAATWESESDDPIAEALRLRSATYRRWYHPSWRILLGFYVADELPRNPLGEPIIPSGTMLPGVVYGRKLESSELCPTCRRREHGLDSCRA